MPRPACGWPGACSAALSSSTQNGGPPASNNRSSREWASIPAIAMSVISAARIEWTIRSSVRKPIWARGCSRSAARLQCIAEPGGIVSSYETFALVSDVIVAHPLPPITMKGISREVIPHSVDSVLDTAAKGVVIVERMKWLDFYLDPSVVDAQGADLIRSILNDALATLDRRQPKPTQ